MYQAKGQGVTYKSICNGVFEAFGCEGMEFRDKSLPGHLKTGHDNVPPDVITAAREMSFENAIEADKKKLITDIRNFAKDIKTKYIEVPYTTDFAVMFLPFEGLYLEILRIPGLIQQIQNEFSITISGPTTLGAFLNSLQMEFRTLAIQEQTDNVWNLLRAVRTEFGKFGVVLEKTKEKLESASKEIDNAGVRTRAIERKLRDVENLPEQQAEKLLENN